MKAPKPIPIERHAPPRSGRIAWSAEPKPNAITGSIKAEEKERARLALEAAVRADGFEPSDCKFIWQMIDVGWGWVAFVKGEALA